MISFIDSIISGSGIRIIISPTVNATKWRLLRKVTDDFIDENDTGAFQVYEGTKHVVLDTTGIVNGVTYYYKSFEYVDNSWLATDSISSKSEYTVISVGIEPQMLLLERLKVGLAAEILAGTLNNTNGTIDVIMGPPPADYPRFPVVSLDVIEDKASNYFLATEYLDEHQDPKDYLESYGWVADIGLRICYYALNPDERIAGRLALIRIIQSNIPLMEQYGFMNASLSVFDHQNFGEYNAPVYYARAVLNGQYMSGIARDVKEITEIDTISIFE